MINKNEFSAAAGNILKSLSSGIPKMIDYKTYIQRNVLDVVSTDELVDVGNGKFSESLMKKLLSLANSRWQNGSVEDLYCLSMAVATIFKEYGWGTDYLSNEGLFRLALQIEDV